MSRSMQFVFKCTALRLQRCGSCVHVVQIASRLLQIRLKNWHDHQRVAMGRGAMLVLASVANRLYTSILRQGKAQARGRLPGGRVGGRLAAKMAARLHLGISQKCGQQRKAWEVVHGKIAGVGGWMGGWVQEWVGGCSNQMGGEGDVGSGSASTGRASPPGAGAVAPTAQLCLAVPGTKHAVPWSSAVDACLLSRCCMPASVADVAAGHGLAVPLHHRVKVVRLPAQGGDADVAGRAHAVLLGQLAQGGRGHVQPEAGEAGGREGGREEGSVVVEEGGKEADLQPICISGSRRAAAPLAHPAHIPICQAATTSPQAVVARLVRQRRLHTLPTCNKTLKHRPTHLRQSSRGSCGSTAWSG